MAEEYIQVGVTALRDPATGGFLPSVPLYIKATPEAEAAKERFDFDVSKLFAEKMHQYIKGGGLVGGRAGTEGKK